MSTIVYQSFTDLVQAALPGPGEPAKTATEIMGCLDIPQTDTSADHIRHSLARLNRAGLANYEMVRVPATKHTANTWRSTA
jgi:hypothetical protein